MAGKRNEEMADKTKNEFLNINHRCTRNEVLKRALIKEKSK